MLLGNACALLESNEFEECDNDPMSDFDQAIEFQLEHFIIEGLH